MLAMANPPIVAATIFFLLINCVNAFWRLECDGSVALARLDPLVNFEVAGDHVHSIKGGSAFSSISTADDLMKSKCASCSITQDHSAYWTPALYFMSSDDGSMTVVAEKPPHKSYYLLNGGMTSGGKTQKIEAFPNGFSMISGSNYNRNSSLPMPQDPNVRYQAPLADMGPWPNESQESLAQRALGFNCMNYDGTVTPEPTLARHSLPDKAFLDANCPDGLRLELMFPSCWNGQKDSENYKSHVAFPDSVMTGNCPQGFDRRLPSLMYETIVGTDHFKGKNGKFVISNGDPTGFGYHGDFIAAWDEGILQQAVDTCTATTGPMAGDMRACSVFEFADGTDKCRLENPLPEAIANENTTGPMPGLPNGMQICNGPEPAPKPGKQAKATPPVSTASTVPVAVVPTIALSSHAAGGIFAAVNNNAAKVASSTASAYVPPATKPTSSAVDAKHYVAAVPPPASSDPTPLSSPPATTPAPTSTGDSPMALQESTISTAWSTQGHEAYENIVVEEEITVTAAKAKRTAEAEPQHEKHHRHRHHKQHGIGGRRLR